MRYKLTLTYDGENYCGWQKQKNGTSIQGELENAIKTILKEDVNLVGSGRTDAKVSALNQVAHFETTNEILDTKKFLRSLNGILNDDIRVLSCEQTNIHARFSAKKKTYLYGLYLSNITLPLKFKRLRVDENLDIKLMKKYSKLLIGTHDYKNFCASNSSVKTTVRTVYSIKFKKVENDLNIYVCGNGFLYKMVRNIVGLLITAGKNKMTKKEFLDFAFNLDAPLKKTAPAENLILYSVEYQ